jgi:hypothetical protein
VHFNARQKRIQDQRLRPPCAAEHDLRGRRPLLRPVWLRSDRNADHQQPRDGYRSHRVPVDVVPPKFYIDIAVPPNAPGGPFGGAGGYGDTLIAGPFTLG